MTKEELIGKLEMVYAGDRNALEEMVGYYDGLKEGIEIVQQENKKQKEVISRAVKYIDDLRDESAERQEFYNCFPDDLYIADINELLDILKEGKK